MPLALQIVLPFVGIVLGWTIKWIYAKFQLSSAEQEAVRVKQEAIKEAQAQKKEILLNAKDELIRERNQQERELRDRRADVQRYEARVSKKEEAVDIKQQDYEKKEKDYILKLQTLKTREAQLTEDESKCKEEIEKISGLTEQEAKDIIIKNLQNDAEHDAQALINKIEEDAKLSAEKKAREILVTAIQRVATETTSDITIATVTLASDEMKGRIIGREGRNIRTLETLTGVDIIIDDTPEAVVISCFDPVRKEIAKQALERLVADGRIHPARIEEIVQKVTREVQNKIYEEGERLLFDLGIHSMSPEGIRALGRLYFRTSYGQNVLSHSKEVANIASLIASEIGANRDLAKRAAVLHDIGKGADTESEQNHAEVGAEMARKMGENALVINAIGAHHNDIEAKSLEAVIVQIADSISAARPGARKETIDNYVNRLTNLEAIAEKFDGVQKAYAIQAGRELRILVNNDKIPDSKVKELAASIAKQIETDLNYPGRIRLTMIRETRVVEYAR